MTHPDPEVLTQLAMNEPLALDAATLVHISDCEQCSAEVAALQRVVSATDLIREDPTLREVTAPDDRVWDRIAMSVGIAGAGEHVTTASSVPQQPGVDDDWMFAGDDGDAEPTAVQQHAPVESIGRPRSRRRTTMLVAAAAVVGVLCGAIAGWALSDRDGGSGSDNQDTTFTTSELVGFDGHTTSGVASFTETSTGGELTIELQPEDVGDGFIQAWLLDEDTGGMVALGVVDGDTGTFAVPKDLDLDAFNQIDISLEPYDGDPQHSAVSLARGPLP